tara:strand:- start:353 stop:685 length:333 start_codon:yes stop_codon:yes gene_type:complete
MVINEKLLKDIHNADWDTLNLLLKEINVRRRVLLKGISTKFTVGQIVEFTTKKGNVERGKIEKINRKTISVRTSPFERWRVGPSYLRPVKADPATPTTLGHLGPLLGFKN